MKIPKIEGANELLPEEEVEAQQHLPSGEGNQIIHLSIDCL